MAAILRLKLLTSIPDPNKPEHEQKVFEWPTDFRADSYGLELADGIFTIRGKAETWCVHLSAARGWQAAPAKQPELAELAPPPPQLPPKGLTKVRGGK